MSVSRRRFVQGAGVAGLGLLAGCGRLPGQAPPTKVPPHRLSSIAVPRSRRRCLRRPSARGCTSWATSRARTSLIEWRYAEWQHERLPDLAAELVGSRSTLSCAATPSQRLRAKQATSTIPIVLGTVAILSATGLVASLARPGGNVTGLTEIDARLSGKRLELLKEAVPGSRASAVLWNPDRSSIATRA